MTGCGRCAQMVLVPTAVGTNRVLVLTAVGTNSGSIDLCRPLRRTCYAVQEAELTNYSACHVFRDVQ